MKDRPKKEQATKKKAAKKAARSNAPAQFFDEGKAVKR